MGDTGIEKKTMISLDRFLKQIKGTENEVWGKILRVEARAKVMTAEAWSLLLQEISGRPAHPSDPAFVNKTAPKPAPNPRRK